MITQKYCPGLVPTHKIPWLTLLFLVLRHLHTYHSYFSILFVLHTAEMALFSLHTLRSHFDLFCNSIINIPRFFNGPNSMLFSNAKSSHFHSNWHCKPCFLFCLRLSFQPFNPIFQCFSFIYNLFLIFRGLMGCFHILWVSHLIAFYYTISILCFHHWLLLWRRRGETDESDSWERFRNAHVFLFSINNIISQL